MIILGIIFLLVVVPSLWGGLVAIGEVLSWQPDKAVTRSQAIRIGRDVYHDGPLWLLVKREFARAYWSAFAQILDFIIVGLLLWLIFRD